MKKPTKSKLIKRLDKLWGEVIRSKGKCDRCGKTSPLNAAHIYSRRNKSTRWVILNGLCLCVGCHFYSHQNPLEFSEFVIQRLGQDLYDDLKRLANTAKHFSVEELLEIEKQLKNVLN